MANLCVYLAVPLLLALAGIAAVDEFDETVYLRQDGEVVCDSTKPKLPTRGAGHVKFSYNPMRTVGKVGPPIFDLAMNLSGDCTTFVPHGYNAVRTRKYSGMVTTREIASLHADQASKTSAIHASVGGSYGSFGGSASMSRKHATKASHRESLVKKTFFTSAYQVDNELSYSPEDPPEVHQNFLDDLVRWNASRFPEPRNDVDREFTRFLFRKYGFFLKVAGLGSSYKHITSLLQSDVSAASSKETDFSAEAQVHAAFVQASGGYSESTSQSQESKTMMKNSQTVTEAVGSRIQPNLQFAGEAHSPGIVFAVYEPICGAIPLSSFAELHKVCYLYLAEEKDAFCLSALPYMREMIATGQYELIRNSFTSMRLNDFCQHMHFPLLGYQISPDTSRWLITQTHVTADHCAVQCSLTKCEVFSFSGSTCKMCWGREVVDMMANDKETCSRMAGRHGVLGKYSWVPETGLCVVHKEGDDTPPRGECHKLTACPVDGPSCFAGFMKWPERNPYEIFIDSTTLRSYYSQQRKKPLMTPQNSFANGNPLAVNHIAPNTNFWITSKITYLNLMNNFKGRPDYRNMRRVNNQVAMMLFRLSAICATRCLRTPGCSFIQTDLAFDPTERGRIDPSEVLCSMFASERDIYAIEPENDDTGCGREREGQRSCQLLGGMLMEVTPENVVPSFSSLISPVQEAR